MAKQTIEKLKLKQEKNMKPNQRKVILDIEDFGMICDAIEIAISPDVLKVNDRFAHMEDIMTEIVGEIEKQSGCQTKDD